MNFETIKTTALTLLNAPRTWGRGLHSLESLAGLAIAKATESAPLKSEEFERLRHELVQSMRAQRAT
jgi:hypothetical protein